MLAFAALTIPTKIKMLDSFYNLGNIDKQNPIRAFSPFFSFSWRDHVKIKQIFTSFGLNRATWTADKRTGIHQSCTVEWN